MAVATSAVSSPVGTSSERPELFVVADREPDTHVGLGSRRARDASQVVRQDHRATRQPPASGGYAGVTALDLPYMVFGSWWYLRFFLPAGPLLDRYRMAPDGSNRRTPAGRASRRCWSPAAWGLYFAHGNEAFQVGWGDFATYPRPMRSGRSLRPERDSLEAAFRKPDLLQWPATLRYDWIEATAPRHAVRWLKARGPRRLHSDRRGGHRLFRARFRGRPSR